MVEMAVLFGHSRAIVIYESGRLDQLIGPIEIIFLLPLGRSVCGVHTRRFETGEEERRSAEAIENWAVIGHRFRGIIYTWTGGKVV